MFGKSGVYLEMKWFFLIGLGTPPARALKLSDMEGCRDFLQILCLQEAQDMVGEA